MFILATLPHPADVAIRRDDPVIEVEEAAVPTPVYDHAAEHRDIVRMDEIRQCIVPYWCVAIVDAEQAAKRLAA